MHEPEPLYDEFDTDPSNGGQVPRRKVTQGNFGPRPFRWRFWLIGALVALLLIGWPTWAGFYTDWLWFKELGYQTVFSTVLTTKLMAGAVGGFAAAYLGVNLLYSFYLKRVVILAGASSIIISIAGR